MKSKKHKHTNNIIKPIMDLYQQLIGVGKNNITSINKCGNCGNEFIKQLQKLHDFVYIVEHTPRPEDPFYSPMFIELIVHKNICSGAFKEVLKKHNLSYEIYNYDDITKETYYIPNTHKRRLLFEMLGKWWFFHNTMAPSMALSEAIHLRDTFFKCEYAYLPDKFRYLVEKQGFPQAVNSLREDEHEFLHNFLDEMNHPKVSCGCIPMKRSSFSRRFEFPVWDDEPPDLEIYETDGVDVKSIRDAVLSGDLYYLTIYNHYDCTDRSLYTTLYNILQKQQQNEQQQQQEDIYTQKHT